MKHFFMKTHLKTLNYVFRQKPSQSQFKKNELLIFHTINIGV